MRLICIEQRPRCATGHIIPVMLANPVSEPHQTGLPQRAAQLRASVMQV